MDVLSLLLILGLTFAFGYLNGLNSAGSIIATVISSRALKPRVAMMLALICMCAGPFLLGGAVAGTISTDLVEVTFVTSAVVITTLVGAIAWVTLAAKLGIPCSTTQAFVGSLIGVVWAGFGTQAIVASGVFKVMLALFLSPLLGTIVGFFMVKFCYRASAMASARPSVNRWFKGGQVMLSLLVAVSFGSNDGQKLIGIVTLGLVSTQHNELNFPIWAAGFSALAMATGILAGSQKIVQTLGSHLYNVQPIHGFDAQTASSVVLLSASILGSPVSGSQVITSAIVGAGSAQRVQMVRWGMFKRIFATWVLTLPCSAFVGASSYVIYLHIVT